jgi:hypothetical protein
MPQLPPFDGSLPIVLISFSLGMKFKDPHSSLTLEIISGRFIGSLIVDNVHSPITPYRFILQVSEISTYIYTS